MLKLTVLEHHHVDRVTVSANTSTLCLSGKIFDAKSDMMFRERCLDSLFNDFEECYKRQESLQRAEKEARQTCGKETQLLKLSADRLNKAHQEEIGRLSTLLMEALSATQENAAARKRRIQCEVSVVKAQADLDIAKTRMTLPGRPWSEELMAASYYALNGDALKDTRSRYLDAYEGAIREHEASLMAEDMELVALYLSWRTEKVTSTQSCNLDLDDEWTRRINLCRLRAAPVRKAYEDSKRSCIDDLHNDYATAASELSSRRKARLKKGAELDTKVQKLVDAITHQRDKELAKLGAKITEIDEEHRRQEEQLRDDYNSRLSSLKKSVQPLVQPLLSAIKKRQEVFAREQEVISKDLRAVQATLTLMTSAIQTLDQGLNSLPKTRTPRPPSTQDRDFWSHVKKAMDPRQRTYEKFKEQRRADESRRQHEVNEDERRRDEERLKREREEWLRREKAEAQARAERKAREYFERVQAKRRQEEEARCKREYEERQRAEAERRAREYEERRRAEAERHARIEEERRRAEAERRAREEEESRQREEEEARRRAEEEKQRSEDARRREEEESTRRRREQERSRREEEDQQNRQGQQHSNNGGGGGAQSATGDDDIDDNDSCAGGTRDPSTAKGRTKFVLKCWKKYTEAWARLMAPDIPRLPFQEIPWPILPPRERLFTKMTITAILSHINKESIRTFILDPEHLQSISPKARIRKELLRFHPDKRIQWLKNVKDEEKEQVDEACKQVVLHLTDLLNTGA